MNKSKKKEDKVHGYLPIEQDPVFNKDLEKKEGEVMLPEDEFDFMPDDPNEIYNDNLLPREDQSDND